MSLVDSTEELEGEPFLLNGDEEWTRADAVIERVLDVLAQQQGSLVQNLLSKQQTITRIQGVHFTGSSQDNE